MIIFAPRPHKVVVPAQPGAGAVAVMRQLDLEARAEAANALRGTPSIMKLIEARIFKFDDFLTDGSRQSPYEFRIRNQMPTGSHR